MKLVSSPVLLLLGVLACAALVPAAEGGLLGGILGPDLNLTLPGDLAGVQLVDEAGGELVEVNLPGGNSIDLDIDDPLSAEAPGPSPARKLLGVVVPATRAKDNRVVRSDVVHEADSGASLRH